MGRLLQRTCRGQSANSASREQFRGRAEAGQQAIQRGDVSARDVGGAGAGRDSAANRSMSSDRGGMGGDRGASGGRGGSAFDAGGGAAQTRANSSRGASSMGSARSSGNMGGGGARGGGGGGGRGGGGRR